MIKKDSFIVRFDLFIKKIPWWLYLIIGNFVIFSLNLSFSDTGFAEEQVSSFSDCDFLVSGLFFAPLLETLFVQLVPIEISLAICKEFFSRRLPFIALLVSASLFALGHGYNSYFILFAFITGIILAACYLVFRRQKHFGFGFLITSLLHFLVNLTSFGFNKFC